MLMLLFLLMGEAQAGRIEELQDQLTEVQTRQNSLIREVVQDFYLNKQQYPLEYDEIEEIKQQFEPEINRLMNEIHELKVKEEMYEEEDQNE